MKVSFVLPYNEGTFHKFGVNKILLDNKKELLYSAGRDGTIKCWDLKELQESEKPRPFFSIQAHNDWVNDIITTNNDGLCTIFHFNF